MSNRKGGHFDHDGIWRTAPRDPPLWKRILSTVTFYILLAVFIGAVLGVTWAMMNSGGDDYRDG